MLALRFDETLKYKSLPDLRLFSEKSSVHKLGVLTIVFISLLLISPITDLKLSKVLSKVLNFLIVSLTSSTFGTLSNLASETICKPL